MIKNLNVILIGVISILSSCQQIEDIEFINEPNSAIVESAKAYAIRNYIKAQGNDMRTRGGNYEMIPYVISGDTVLYVVNYEGGGFEIFSNDYRLPMVLVKSKTGSYYPNSVIDKTPFESYVQERALELHNIGKSEDAKMNGMWKAYSRGYSYGNAEEPGEEEEGRFLGYAYEYFDEEYMPRGGRLSTKWDQREYYNDCMPFLEDITDMHGATGCAAIMLGQYLWHSNKYFGTPTHMVTDAQYDASINRYSFSGSSDSVWKLLDDGTDPDFICSPYRMRPTSVMLGYIAKEIDTDYEKRLGMGAYADYNVLPNFLKSHYYFNYEWNEFNIKDVEKILKDGRPLMAVSWGVLNTGNSDIDGHAYLIDYAHAKSYTIYEVYSRDPKLCNPGETEPDIDIEEENLDWYISNFKNVYWYTYTTNEFWISMNWGWGGENNEKLINAELDYWLVKMSGGKTFTIFESLIMK